MPESKTYLVDGTEVMVVEECQTGAIVQVVYGGDDEEPRFGEPKFVKRVYASEAVPKLLPELEKRQAEYSDLIGKLAAIRAEVNTAEQERKRLVAKLAQVPALRRMEAILDGRMSHYVREDYATIGVYAADDLISKDDYGREYHPRTWKLISLFGLTPGNLEFRINDYSDGSGRDRYQCWLFETRHEAVEFASARLADKFKTWQKDKRGDLRYIVDSYRQIGVEPPAECEAEREAQKAALKASRIAKAKKDLEEATNAE